MRTVESKLSYYDFFGDVYQAHGKTGGQQEDPLKNDHLLSQLSPPVRRVVLCSP